MKVFKYEEKEGVVLVGVAIDMDTLTSDLDLLPAIAEWHNRAGS